MQILSEKEENLHRTSLGEENCFILWYFVLFIGANKARENEKEQSWQSERQKHRDNDRDRCAVAVTHLS